MTPDLRIYNTQTRQIETFTTIEPGVVRMYVCGVTPYASAHVGHGMSAIVFDTIRRYLEHRGFRVRHAQNFTDIDDKIILRAAREGTTPQAMVERLIAEWLEDTDSLNILRATVYPRVTQEIPAIVAMVDGLIARGHAYAVDGDVYFRVRSFPSYGKLSHRRLDDLLSGARIEVDERKDDPLDFALWKAAKPGEPSWDSPWGQGRPGWHIECSAMCAAHLDGAVDIHGGGADLIFPHHENEIAQSEAFLGREPFARFWVHNGLLQLSDQKMSKSLGNMVRIREIAGRGLAPAFRLMVLQSHYRAPLTYTDDGLLAAENGLDRLRAAARAAAPNDGEGGAGAGSNVAALAAEAETRFHAAMSDDFDTPGAVAALFDLGRAINRHGASGGATADVDAARGTLRDLAGILGLPLSDTGADAADSDAAPFVDLLLDLRNQLRAAKQWAIADAVRDGLAERGIAVEDGPTGSTWSWARRDA
ncbi:MAG: Cysteinyl-tRNA synthetase [uncultured Thermomicrobiales bacterium]|uniref:Cysteine--tRNA ligase n=1 Tax=uncultured Thermomicrobiales bacterium TaxID=1645740 RepID=A0A6J4V0Y5_9BACT|nr:MAG: Cysteinyl-tRNA synthetase [uncultured Thermomicrobiales bacterium]